jgi:Fic family protein
MELEALFEFLNSDSEFHPIVQSWMLHFRLLNIRLFSECTTKIASLLQHFWLKKKGMDVFGLLSIEHELYANKNEYQNFIDDQQPHYINDQQQQFDFGMELYGMQLDRLKNLLRSYFRKQVDFEKLNPRQKNIMNYVFERGYKLKEIDDSVLNKRQKLIMYIIQNRGFISTKELVSEFECNRKTIQRDFTELTENNLVKVIGKGAGLRYAVNLTERKHEGLAQYQSSWVVDEPVEMDEE